MTAKRISLGVMNDSETTGLGRIPDQLIAHTLFYFTKPGDLVLDPMVGGGVVPDVCLIFGRKCQSFDISTRAIIRLFLCSALVHLLSVCE